MERETLGSPPPGPTQDPNSSTRSIGEPGMPEISCIASEVDDLRPLGLHPAPRFLLLMRPVVGSIMAPMLRLVETRSGVGGPAVQLLASIDAKCTSFI